MNRQKKKLPCGRIRTISEDLNETDIQKLKAKLDDYVSKKGLKYSEQRWQIAEVIARSKGHSDAQNYVRQIQKKFPQIGPATVYRNIKILVEAGLVHESYRDQEGKLHYEVQQDEHHDHIICLDCGEIFEFFNPQIEKLQDQSAEKLNFKIDSHHHVIQAHCKMLKSKS